MANLSKQFLLYAGSDSLPVVDYTEDTNWERTELTMMADALTPGSGTFVIRVPEGDIPDFRNGGQKFLGGHHVMKVTVGSNTLWRGRASAQDISKGPTRGSYPQEWSAVEGDYNLDTGGIIVHNWVRPAETDAARAQALVAAYLSGSPRATTNLNGSNFVITGSNTVTMPAKTYSGVTPAEILSELATEADKDVFVDVDGNLHYHGADYTGFDSTMRISDDPADLNSLTFAPIEPTASQESSDELTHLRTYWGPDEVQHTSVVNNSRAHLIDYWADVFFDSDAQNQTQADRNAQAVLNARTRDDASYTVTVGMPGVIQTNGTPMTGDDTYKIKAGQRIQFKMKAARDGYNENGVRRGNLFYTTHIKSITWTMPTPDAYYARLELEKPRKIGPLGHGKTQPKSTTPTPPPSTIPDTPGSGVATWDFENHGFANDLFDTTGTYGSGLVIQTAGTPTNPNSTAAGWTNASHRQGDSIPLSSSTTYIFSVDVRWSLNPGIRDIYMVYNGNSIGTGPGASDELLVDGSAGYAQGVTYTVTKTFTTPAGLTAARIAFSAYAGIMVDNMSVSSVASPQTNEAHAIDYGALPHSAGHYLPSDYVLARFEALADSIPAQLDDIGDVDATSPSGGDVLTWNSTDSEWEPVAPSSSGLGSWTDYTPTWTTTGTAPALGNGTLIGRHKDLDANTCMVRLQLIAGTTTTFGTGTWSFSIPHTAVSGKGNQILTGWILDSGTDNKTAVGRIASGGTTVLEVYPEGGNVVTNTVPMTWTTSDTLMLQGHFER